MSKKILFILPNNLMEGQPSNERISSFVNFYKNNGLLVFEKTQPINIREKLDLFVFLRKNEIKNIFISMPPFRNWWLFSMIGINVILDIRDGWSIAMKTGYGHTTHPQPIKSIISKYIESYAIKRSLLTITCTPGLKKYFTEISSSNILLIPNGYTQGDQEIVAELLRSCLPAKDRKKTKEIIAVCAGQFSEYGYEKVKKIIVKLDEMYPGKIVKIKLIGSDFDNNKWLHIWLLENNYINISVEILPRMSRKEMYRIILLSDVGLAVIRDPDYDFGTKIFDYILCETPVLNYFDEENSFNKFFKGYFVSELHSIKTNNFNRNFLIENNREVILKEILNDC